MMQTLAVLILVANTTGCATSAYWTDRKRDAADIFTCTLGVGAGVKARVGPLQVGAFGNGDMVGLRGGEWFAQNTDIHAFEVVSPLPLPEMVHAWPSFTTSEDVFWIGTLPLEGTSETRKGYGAQGRYLPIVTVSDRLFYYSQIEIAVGCVGTVRLGFNPGELLDFILGWTTIDIFADDVSLKQQEERERERVERERLDRSWMGSWMEPDHEKEGQGLKEKSNQRSDGNVTNVPHHQP